MPHALRTRFKKEIVAEFLPPANFAHGKKSRAGKQRVAILLDGAPTVPSKHSLLEFFAHKSYWVFHPRYRGTWESDGTFLKKPLDEDVIDVIDQLPRGFVSFGDGKKYRVKPGEIILIASSFGGPAGILASRDPRVTKVVCISPVVDWQAPSKAEPLDARLFDFWRNAFGNGYRFGTGAAGRAAGRANELRAWKKLASGTFYNPVRHVREIDGSKLFIFHARDDESVRAREVIQFARATGATLKLFARGGHLSAGHIVPKHWNRIKKFLAKTAR